MNLLGGGGFNYSSNKSGSQAMMQSQPWDRQQPYLADIFSQGKDLYNRGGIPAYPGQTYAGFNPFQQQYFQNIRRDQHARPDQGGAYYGADMERGLGKHMVLGSNQLMSPTTWSGGSRRMLNEVARGGQLGSNPFLDSMYDRAAGGLTRHFTHATEPQRNALFSRSGRSGSGIQALREQEDTNALGRSLSDLSTQFYGGAYEGDRERQMQAAAMGADQGMNWYQRSLGAVPTYVDLLNQRADRLGAVGERVYDQSQRMVDDEVARWRHSQMAPWENLSRYANLILGQKFDQSESTSSSFGRGRSYGVNFSLR